jgi:putative ABC transport system permease protein
MSIWGKLQLNIRQKVMVGLIACILAIGFIGGLFPAVRAARLPVTTALREL